MHEKKKKHIREILRHYVNLLDLKEYRVLSSFKTVGEDRDLKDAFAVVRIDDERKIIYIKLSTFDFNRMKKREIKRYLLHELLHSFFSELDSLFEKTIKDAGFSKRKSRGLLSTFDEIEHKKVSHLIKLMLRTDRYSSALRKYKRNL